MTTIYLNLEVTVEVTARGLLLLAKAAEEDGDMAEAALLRQCANERNEAARARLAARGISSVGGTDIVGRPVVVVRPRVQS